MTLAVKDALNPNTTNQPKSVKKQKMTPYLLSASLNNRLKICSDTRNFPILMSTSSLTRPLTSPKESLDAKN